MADIDNVRTLEDLIAVVRKLYFNMDKISENYYNMFWNPEPMILTLELYDETGRLVTKELKNRAAELSNNLVGRGNPNDNQIEAKQGVFYLDSLTNHMYYKTGDESASGWVDMYSESNPGDFLRINGSAANLTDLNVDNVTDGVLTVDHGGTGVATNFEGLIRANGLDEGGHGLPFSMATKGKDYVDPDNLVGMIAYFPKNETRDNWLWCNGGTYSATTYPKLAEYLSNVPFSLTAGRLPNLSNHFIRSWDGTSGSSSSTGIGKTRLDSLKIHTHSVEGSVSTGSAGAHTHGKGTLRVYGSIITPNDDEPLTNADSTTNSGALRLTTTSKKGGKATGSGKGYRGIEIDTNWGGFDGSTASAGAHSHSLSGSAFNISDAGGDTETYPKHIILVPMIYAGRKAT